MGDSPPRSPTTRAHVGISSCLLGNPVRYDGGHKRDAYLCETLSALFEWVPACPETAIGLGTPRPPIHLRRLGDQVRVVGVHDDERDVTDALAAEAARMALAEPALAGFVLKQDSPSCGLYRVPVYDRHGAHPVREGQGGFANELAKCQPLLPLIDEAQMHDAELRQRFIWCVLSYHRWLLIAGPSMQPRDLVDFHTRHKYLLMAHDQQRYRRLGAWVAQAGAADDFLSLSAGYIEEFMAGLGSPATAGNHVNVMQHIAGYFSECIGASHRVELTEAIDAYRLGEIPLAIPMALLRDHQRRHPQPHLENQHYLDQAAFI